MNELLDQIANAIKSNSSQTPTKILVPKFEPVELSKNNFHDIAEVECNNKICFIDGGNNEVLKTPSMSPNNIASDSLLPSCNHSIPPTRTDRNPHPTSLASAATVDTALTNMHNDP